MIAEETVHHYNPSMYAAIIIKLWRLLSRFHRRVYVLAVTIVACEIVKLIPAAVLATVIDTFGHLSVNQIPLLASLIGVVFISSCVVSLLDAHIEYEAANLAFDSEEYLLQRVSQKLLTLPLGYHEKHNTGSVVNVLQRGSDRLVELIIFSCRELLPTLTQLAVTLIVVFWIGWIPGLVFFLFVPVFAVLIHRYGIQVQPLRQAYHHKMDEAAGYIGERVMNVRSVQEFAVQHRELDAYQNLLTDYIGLQRNRMRFQRSYSIFRDMTLNFARAAIMATGIWLVLRGSLTPGLLVLFVTLSEKANLALFRTARFYDRAGDTIESIQSMVHILETEEAILEKPQAKPVATLQGSIDFRTVNFAYTAGKEVLHDVSFSVQPKQMIAIIGRSGAGKSTIVKLLYRHFDVTGGSIRVDGTDIRDYKLHDYRRHLASVPQDVEIFNATVRENIAFGAMHATQAEIVAAAKTAHAHAFIQQFQNGYDTIVGERGVRLSGGQRQRIGIARAILTKPAILIFDEATSSLDTESEQLIQEAMQSIARQCTMIVIAHRLSTIEKADLVVVIDEGTVVEMGTHDDLLSRKGVYRQMRSLQRLGDIRK